MKFIFSNEMWMYILILYCAYLCYWRELCSSYLRKSSLNRSLVPTTTTYSYFIPTVNQICVFQNNVLVPCIRPVLHQHFDFIIKVGETIIRTHTSRILNRYSSYFYRLFSQDKSHDQFYIQQTIYQDFQGTSEFAIQVIVHFLETGQVQANAAENLLYEAKQLGVPELISKWSNMDQDIYLIPWKIWWSRQEECFFYSSYNHGQSHPLFGPVESAFILLKKGRLSISWPDYCIPLISHERHQYVEKDWIVLTKTANPKKIPFQLFLANAAKAPSSLYQIPHTASSTYLVVVGIQSDWKECWDYVCKEMQDVIIYEQQDYFILISKSYPNGIYFQKKWIKGSILQQLCFQIADEYAFAYHISTSTWNFTARSQFGLNIIPLSCTKQQWHELYLTSIKIFIPGLDWSRIRMNPIHMIQNNNSKMDLYSVLCDLELKLTHDFQTCKEYARSTQKCNTFFGMSYRLWN